MAQQVKNLPAIQEMWVSYLGQEDPLEEEMEEWQPTLVFLPGNSPWGCKNSETTKQAHLTTTQA